MEKENAINEEISDTGTEKTHHTLVSDRDECLEDDRLTKDCPLDVFTPQALIDRLKVQQDCTEDLVDLIKAVHVNQAKMKKLCKVFCALPNCDTNVIVELSRDRNRMLRYISTYLVLSKIKQWIEEEKGFGVVEKMYDEVFLVRFRDVDFNIRAMCVEFMCEWVIAVPEIFNNPCYLKYIGWALSDKNDTVRRKGVTSSTRLVQRKVDIGAFIARFKSRIIELTLYDKNHGLREEGRSLCMALYLNDLMDKSDVYKVLGSVREKDKKGRLGDVISKILSEGYTQNVESGLLGNYEGIHELFSNTSLSLCSHIPHESREVVAFMHFILDFLREKSLCCELGSLCYIKILGVFSESITSIDKYHEMLDVVKDNKENVLEVLVCINNTNVEVFKSQADVTNRLLSTTKELISLFKCEEMFELFVQLLKKLENDFSPSVHSNIEYFRSFSVGFTRCMIKSFDISRDVNEEYPTDVKCYAILWRILCGDYEYVNSCCFNDVSSPEILCDFLLFFKEKCTEFGVLNEKVEEAFDQASSFKVSYEKLSLLIYTFADMVFIDEKSCISLFKLVEEDLLVDYSYLIFEKCGEKLVAELFSRSKSRLNLIIGYFKYLTAVEDNVSLVGMAKLIGSKCNSSKKLLGKDKVVFRGIKALVDQKKTFLYDTVLIHFIPLLTVNECIVIEQGVGKSRFKASLVRKSKGRDVIRSSPGSSTDATFAK